MNRIYYMIDPDSGEKVLPFQYYDSYKLITIPMSIGDKKPFIKGWNKTKKTIHPRLINENIGILTGKINNITILDIDIKDNGLKVWKELIKQFGEIITPTVRTPTGGIHLYFKYNKKIHNMNRLRIGDKKIGWDIRSDGGVIMCPPSSDKSGKRYQWMLNKKLEDVSLAAMPSWVEKYILEHLK